jgi:hypothetical protein
VFLIRDDRENGVDFGLAFFHVHRGAEDLDRVSAGDHFAVSGDKGELQRGNDLVAVDSFFFFVIVNEGDDIVGHGVAVSAIGAADVWRRKRVGARPTPFFRQKLCEGF